MNAHRGLFSNEEAQLFPSGLISPNRASLFSAARAIKAEKPQKLPQMCSKRQLSFLQFVCMHLLHAIPHKTTTSDNKGNTDKTHTTDSADNRDNADSKNNTDTIDNIENILQCFQTNNCGT